MKQPYFRHYGMILYDYEKYTVQLNDYFKLIQIHRDYDQDKEHLYWGSIKRLLNKIRQPESKFISFNHLGKYFVGQHQRDQFNQLEYMCELTKMIFVYHYKQILASVHKMYQIPFIKEDNKIIHPTDKGYIQYLNEFENKMKKNVKELADLLFCAFRFSSNDNKGLYVLSSVYIRLKSSGLNEQYNIIEEDENEYE